MVISMEIEIIANHALLSQREWSINQKWIQVAQYKIRVNTKRRKSILKKSNKGKEKENMIIDQSIRNKFIKEKFEKF
jgi:hypothetical protein